MTRLRRRAEKPETMTDRATQARRHWWGTSTKSNVASLVTSVVRFAAGEINAARLPLGNPEEMRKRASSMLHLLRTRRQMIRSEDQVRFYVLFTHREIDLARLNSNDPLAVSTGIAQRAKLAQVNWHDQLHGYVKEALDPHREVEAQQIIESLVLKLFARPGLEALEELTGSLSSLNGQAPIRADRVDIHTTDPVAQTITIGFSDPEEYRRVCEALNLPPADADVTMDMAGFEPEMS